MKRFNARFEGKDENGVITRTAIDGIEAENSVEALAVIERFLQSEFVGIKKIERFDNVSSFVNYGTHMAEEVEAE